MPVLRRVLDALATHRDASPDRSRASEESPPPAPRPPQRILPRRIPMAVVCPDSPMEGTDEAVQGVVVAADPQARALRKLAATLANVDLRPWIAGTCVPLAVHRCLAIGSNSVVVGVHDTDGALPYALKVVPLVLGAERAAANLGMLRRLQHRNLVRYFDSFDHTFNDTRVFCIRLEYCQPGTLRQFVKRAQSEGQPIPPEAVTDFVAQIATGLAYIHRQEFIHGDLQLPNILRTADGQLKLAGYGSSCSRSRSRDYPLTITGGSRTYAPPEWMHSTTPCRPLEPTELPPPSYDLWSLGCVLSELATAKFLRDDRLYGPRALAEDALCLEEVAQEMATVHSGAFADLSASLLRADPQQRRTAEQVRAALPRHPRVAHLLDKITGRRRELTAASHIA
eukprot:EG_transcript_13734